MMKWLLFLFTACSLGSRVFTMQEYSEIPIGATKDEVTQLVGEPYRSYTVKNGMEELEYIETIMVGSLVTAQRHYFILLQNGKVVSKRYTQEMTAPYNIDSYHLEMTQNADEQDIEIEEK